MFNVENFRKDLGGKLRKRWQDHRVIYLDEKSNQSGLLTLRPSPQLVAVRYAWADSPECNLYNNAELPAPPFRTNDWPGVTVGKS